MRKLTIIGMAMTLIIAMLAFSGSAAAGNGEQNFRAHLHGGEENPPVATQAQGQATFKFSEDGSELHYKLIVANIEDVFAAHIHCGVVGVNGPVGVTLFNGAAVTVNGILIERTVLGPNPGNTCGWNDLADVHAALLSGDTYVNVHTTENPSGEIRGQIH